MHNMIIFPSFLVYPDTSRARLAVDLFVITISIPDKNTGTVSSQVFNNPISNPGINDIISPS